MTKSNKNRSVCLAVFLIVLCTLSEGCKKFLEKKTYKTQVVPTTLEDLRALLNNLLVNSTGPALLEVAADDYYITTADWQNLMSQDESSLCLNYLWDKDATPYSTAWNATYQYPIYYSNIVLDQLNITEIPGDKVTEYNAIKGSALFYRAFAFHQLAQLYCAPYSPTSDKDPGIVLKITSNINDRSFRSTVKETYDQIIKDLTESEGLLPRTSSIASIPNKVAAYGLLARVYLTMRDYSNAGKFATLCIKEKSDLIDFNSLVPVTAPPVKSFNTEVIFHTTLSSASVLQNTRSKIDSFLYQSYSAKDLRKTVFFKTNTGVNLNTVGFQGSYHGSNLVYAIFNGITTGEMFLIRAECSARAGQKEAALDDLNALLIKRWKNDGSWQSLQTNTSAEALSLILTERRKELVFRGLRWSDIRRLNLEGANITLKRIIDNKTYILPPNDIRSVMLIPWEVIERSDVQQNPR